MLLFAGLVFAALAVGSALADAAIGIGQTGTPIQANKQGTGSAQALPSRCSQAGTTVSCTFSYTGVAQGFTVPAGVGSVTVAAFGAQGGHANLSDGGLGGEATATLSVNAGDVLEVLVGGQGGIYTRGDGGFNGGGVGGAAGTGGVGGGGGGGASDVRAGSCAGALSCDLSARVLVAGGGGGSALGGGNITGQGGGGGYTTGGRGASGTAGGGGGGQRVSRESAGTADSSGDCPVAPTDGTAGGTVTQDAGGAGGAGGQGGSGEPGNGGGGGGGGYWGGGGGGDGGLVNHSGGGSGGGGGGGGSSYAVSAAMKVSMQAGVESGNGEVTVTYYAPTRATCLDRFATIVAKGGGLTRGTPGKDVIVGSKAPDRILSGGGNDRVCSRGGDAVVGTGNGADRVAAGPGDDRWAGRQPERPVSLRGGLGQPSRQKQRRLPVRRRDERDALTREPAHRCNRRVAE